MWRMGTEAGHCVFCSKDSCNEGTETKDYYLAFAFPSPRGKMSSDLLLATACCSGCDCVPVIRAFGVQQPHTCATVGPQAFLEGVGG